MWCERTITYFFWDHLSSTECCQMWTAPFYTEHCLFKCKKRSPTLIACNSHGKETDGKNEWVRKTHQHCILFLPKKEELRKKQLVKLQVSNVFEDCLYFAMLLANQRRDVWLSWTLIFPLPAPLIKPNILRQECQSIFSTGNHWQIIHSYIVETTAELNETIIIQHVLNYLLHLRQQFTQVEL